ncbi:MAG: phospholipid/cholesterol/gamma-HCH transport system substrate-binding protein [Pseudonocardiales bacterium]|nr:phospholipid/cholesterol/gamma-HCH transport system substrate-binding protein [Pseudonocardiales bacterium]
MLRRSTKIQLVIFVIITLVGVSYVSAKYVGLTKGIFGPGTCTVNADFPDSGGIFSNAEVTYRGVTVGSVGKLDLIDNGVRVQLKIEDCSKRKIPLSAMAEVSNRSVIGEQYVNLIPPNGDGPYLRGGEIIPMSRNKLPVATQVLLTNLDNLVRSVDVNNLQIAVKELGNAFNGQGPTLGALLDANSNLLQAAQQNLPDTLALIKASNSVLKTQLDEAPAMLSFAHSLNLLSGQLKASDSDIRRLLDNGPADLNVLRTFVQNNRTDLGVTFANLATTGNLLVRNLNGIEELFELYPALAAGTYTVLAPDGTGRLGFVVNSPNPRDCGSTQANRDPREGYEGTVVRAPSDLTPHAPNLAAHCTVNSSTGINVRGSQNSPVGDPISTSGSGVAYPRVTTGDTVTVGTNDGSSALLGDKSWVAMLTNSLH